MGPNLRYPKLPVNGGRQLQAVILAGGRGERLRPLTENVPKPMVMVGDRPFIHHLILQLKSFGISNVLILAGYKSEVIENYFASVEENDMQITIARTDESFSKSERLMDARELLQSRFILLYSDNYVQFDIRRVIDHPAKNVLTLCKKKPGNVLIEPDTMKVKQFLHDSRDESASYVEVGYSKFDKEDLINEIEKTDNLDLAISNLSKFIDVFGIELSNGYLSISDIVRLEHTKTVFENASIVLIDRDGVINQKPEKANYVVDEKDINYIPETLDFMATASKKYSKKFVVISNQAGISRGIMTSEQVDRVNLKIKSDLEIRGIEILDFFYCPHGWDDGCDCRKPNPGLLFQASEKFGFVLRNTTFIGDDIRDSQAAMKAGAKAILVDRDQNHPNIPGVTCVEHLNDEIMKYIVQSEL